MKMLHKQEGHYDEAHPTVCDNLRQQELNPIKPAHKPMLTGRLAQLTTSIFNPLGQYASSAGNRTTVTIPP